MSDITTAELVEIVPDLRAMADVEASAEVRAALIRLADRYAAMADEILGPARFLQAPPPNDNLPFVPSANQRMRETVLARNAAAILTVGHLPPWNSGAG